MKRRRKPKTIPLSPRSERTRKRLAMSIAWEALSASDQCDRLNEAERIIGYLKDIV